MLKNPRKLKNFVLSKGTAAVFAFMVWHDRRSTDRFERYSEFNKTLKLTLASSQVPFSLGALFIEQ